MSEPNLPADGQTPDVDHNHVPPNVAKKRALSIFKLAAKKKNDEVKHAAAVEEERKKEVTVTEEAAPKLVAVPIETNPSAPKIAEPAASVPPPASVAPASTVSPASPAAATPAAAAAPATPAPAAAPAKKGWSLFGKSDAKAAAVISKKAVVKKSVAGAKADMTGKFGQKKKTFMQALDSLNNIGMGKQKTAFIENLAILLNSGLSVVEALNTIMAETRSKPMKKILQKIVDEVESGIALWCAMDNQNFFSPYALALIRIGEEAGALSRNMEYLAVQQEKDRALKAKVQMAMIYPGIVLTLTAIITLGLAWFVLPQLVGILTSLNVELPLVTKIIIWVANFMKENGIIAVPSFFAVSVLIACLCKYTSLRGPTEQFVFMVPGIGPLAKSATIARFGVILGSLLKAGVPLVESIRSMADVTDTVYYKKFYYKLADEVEVGETFASAFKKIKGTGTLLPLSVQQLISTGEKSGKLAEMLLRVADIYEKKAEEWAQKLPVILEPILLIFIGGLVGTIAFAIIVPIYSLVGSVGR
ncbi:MAG TPA: type II secretion system F family protein [Candidatus Peribacteria bacterium]|nr:type II secretion system F family protein [Candidatus Peribacteria bacterium]